MSISEVIAKASRTATSNKEVLPVPIIHPSLSFLDDSRAILYITYANDRLAIMSTTINISILDLFVTNILQG